MKTKIFLSTALLAFVVTGCDEWTEQKTEMIQKPYAYTDKYYENLRAYKESEHQIFYGWFAAYAHKEGVVAPYKKSPSWGEHFAGLPDSMDFCSVWMGLPTKEENPIAYNEMRQVRKLKGIKMLMPTICRIERQMKEDGVTPKYAVSYDEVNKDWVYDDTSIATYAADLLAQLPGKDEDGEEYIDGIDLDYEPEGDWLNGSNFTKFVQIIGKSIGPMAETEAGRKKYLIIDFFSKNYLPPKETLPYVNFYVRQAYTQGFSEHSDARLQTGFDDISAWCPANMYVVTENFGEWWANGGSPYLAANGSAAYSPDGKRMYSLEGMARWNPRQGTKKGFGAFYFDRDYQHYPAYGYVRNAIQAANPAVK